MWVFRDLSLVNRTGMPRPIYVAANSGDCRLVRPLLTSLHVLSNPFDRQSSFLF